MLAFAALLCVAALQLHEAGHWHEASDTTAHCLVCKSASGLATAQPAETGLPQFAAVLLPQAERQPLPASSPSHRLARGPPSIS